MPILPRQLDMLINMTPKLLSHISKTIAAGEPLWALLVANEYLDSNSPLHQALVTKAASHLAVPEHTTGFRQEIIAGKRLCELAVEARHQLRMRSSITKDGTQTKRFVPSAQSLHIRSKRLPAALTARGDGPRTNRCCAGTSIPGQSNLVDNPQLLT